MDKISKDEFLKLIDDSKDIFDFYSDPVRIGKGSSDDLVLMSVDLYDKLIKNKARNTDSDADIRYYICELKMPEEARAQLEQKAKQLEMTLDELFNATLKNFIDYVESCKEKNIPPEKMFPEEDIDSEEKIEFIRCYPVRRGETEAQAKKRALEMEQREGTDPFPG